MNTYDNIGLNDFMQPVNSPITEERTPLDAYSFQSVGERGIVINNLVRSIGADKINAGTVVVSINLGTSASGSVILDGANNRIIVHDGTTNRIVIGNV